MTKHELVPIEGKLKLVPAYDSIPAPQPAAFFEAAAAKYVRMSREAFRKELLFTGIIPFIEHVGGKTRIYLRADLDAYLDSRPRYKMNPREVSLVAMEVTK